MATLLRRVRPSARPGMGVSVRARHSGQQRLKESRFPVILTQACPRPALAPAPAPPRPARLTPQHVPGVGDEGEEVLVRRGFARNFLLARRLAVYCTPETRRQYAPVAAVRSSPAHPLPPSPRRASTMRSERGGWRRSRP